VFFAYHSHVVWCPKFRRKVLVPAIGTRLKHLGQEVCEEHQAEIEELEVMPDHAHRHGQRGPAVRDAWAGQADQGTFIAALATGISQAQDSDANALDEQLFCEHGGWSALKRQKAV
jgi:hypothetical protein